MKNVYGQSAGGEGRGERWDLRPRGILPVDIKNSFENITSNFECFIFVFDAIKHRSKRNDRRKTVKTHLELIYEPWTVKYSLPLPKRPLFETDWGPNHPATIRKCCLFEGSMRVLAIFVALALSNAKVVRKGELPEIQSESSVTFVCTLTNLSGSKRLQVWNSIGKCLIATQKKRLDHGVGRLEIRVWQSLRN